MSSSFVREAMHNRYAEPQGHTMVKGPDSQQVKGSGREEAISGGKGEGGRKSRVCCYLRMYFLSVILKS